MIASVVFQNTIRIEFLPLTKTLRLKLYWVYDSTSVLSPKSRVRSKVRGHTTILQAVELEQPCKGSNSPVTSHNGGHKFSEENTEHSLVKIFSGRVF